MNKPKGKTPSLLSGKKAEKIEARGKTQCKRCHKSIGANDECFKLLISQKHDFSKIKKYCHDCFGNMIDQTEKDLKRIKSML